MREIALRDGRYSYRAFEFLQEGLEYSVRRLGREEAEGAERHVSGQELLDGLREYAKRLFGPLAGYVWRSWGVHHTIDWGHIVFLLVEHQMLRSQEEDSIEDFSKGFDFDEAFVKGYRIELPPEIVVQTPLTGE